jgi:hypothetical protein
VDRACKVLCLEERVTRTEAVAWASIQSTGKNVDICSAIRVLCLLRSFRAQLERSRLQTRQGVHGRSSPSNSLRFLGYMSQ